MMKPGLGANHKRETTPEGTGESTPEQDAQFWDYVTHAAQFMVNTLE